MHRLFHILLFLFPMISVGQNLVPNGSFEEYTWCSNFNQGSGWALNWITPWNGGTPDYFNECSLLQGSSVPDNYFGFQYARTGAAYMGIYAFQNWPNLEIKEFVSIELSDSLASGASYVFKAFVSLADESAFRANRLGFLISDTLLPDSVQYYEVQPTYFNTELLADTTNWVLLTDTIVASGFERYLTIGCFFPDSLSDTAQIGNLDPLTPVNDRAYYYIDDVSLISLDTLLSIEKSEFTFSIYPNPATTNLTIESHTPLAQVCVRDVAGRQVNTQTLKQVQGDMQIDVSSLPSGIYLIEVLTQNGQRSVQKVVVE